MQTAATDALVGRRLEGRYRILDRVARGGMSTVYAAVDERLDRMVAVKVMNSALSADPAFSDRFAREARAAARLTHLNAVSVYDQGHEIAADGHHVFLVMELVEGRTLRELIHERGRLTPAEAVSIMEPVLSALSAAHRAGLVHRDVKPENILLSDEGVVKVADFGLARAVESDSSSTRTGLMMGTVAYCSPEQLSRGNADPRSDVYSAGIVLFELLTGHPPYRGESAMNVAYQHVHNRVPAPSSKVRGVPSEIDEIVVAATDSDPTGRPTDAGALLAELADVRAELGLPVMPVPPRTRPRRSHRADAHSQSHRAESHETQVDPARGQHEHPTTALDRGTPVRHDTTVAPGHGAPNGESRTVRTDARDGAPPPPVVTLPSKKERRSPRARRRRRRLITLLIVIALGLASYFGGRALIAWRFAHVPEVSGMTQPQALAELRAAGYHTAVQPGPQYSGSVPAGRVVDTDPRSRSRLPTGRTVTITISAGPHLYPIPSVQNQMPDAARNTLQAANITVAQDVVRRHSDTVPENEVVGTDPAAGRAVRNDRSVKIVVSLGPPIVDVPELAQGTSYEDERRILHKADFKVREVEAFNDTVPADSVVSIDPSDHAPKFSTITMTVSKGPQLVTIPDIPTFTDAADAVAQLKALGLQPTIKAAVEGQSGNPPVVLKISPGAGAKVPLGSPVTVTTF